ncbi:MAG: glycosyltransferase family 9 protein [Aurantibacter sp.]
MAQNENSTSHILVIRLSAMGDVAMTVPVLSEVCSEYPELKMTFLTRGFFEPMFTQLPNVEVHTVDVKGKHRGVRGLWKLYKELKKRNIKAVADLHNVLRSNILKLFFRFSGIPFIQIDKGRAEKKALTASNNKIFKPLKSTHQRYADVFGSLGLPLSLPKSSSRTRLPMSKKVKELIGDGAQVKLGIAPFAAFQGKMYPLEFMEVVIENLNKNYAYQLFLFGGGESEAAQLSRWETKFKGCINCAGKLSFEEELALISNLDIMLSMDSGNGHLAAIYGVSVITLWGVTHPYAGFAPFGQDPDSSLFADRGQYPMIPTSVYGNKMPLGYEKAMETIAPEEVIYKIQDVLREK